MATCLHFLLLSLSLLAIHSTSTPQVYIVYMGGSQVDDPANSHIHLLSTVFSSSEEEAGKSVVYKYKHGLSGFAAVVSAAQAKRLSAMRGVVSVFRSRTLKLHTTRSWDFMGLPLDNSPNQLQHDIVVGLLDTGVWPESYSFRENDGAGPIPSSWKGKCVKGEEFDPKTACNGKLIGARYYLKGMEQQYGKVNTSGNAEYRSARDAVGHGTHTASTAVGSVVDDASFFGLGRGRARGGAPAARLAVYKVCWNQGFDAVCTEADILAAFDDALRDGVNVLSASFGFSPPLVPFFASAADIGSFHAMQRGVSVVFSAGNDGPDPSLVQNVAPWSISVGASSIDRAFPTQIIIDNNLSVVGESLMTRELKGRIASAINYFEDGYRIYVNNDEGRGLGTNLTFCICAREKWIKSRPATGKIVLCFSTIGPISSSGVAQAALRRANASALVYAEPMTKQLPDVDFIPTVRVDLAQGTKMLHYIAQSQRLPTVEIRPTKTSLGEIPAPVVAYFSSRGPSSLAPDILKPDVTAPGIGILAAWPPNISPTPLPTDRLSVNWNFQSGTSMACPHVAGAVALIASAHPHWSPATIRSALITTAYAVDTSDDYILPGGSTAAGSSPFDIGAGHINPLRALDPGLVYDLKTKDYVLFLCNLGYSEDQINSIVLPCSGTDTSCPKRRKTNSNMNYPSISVPDLQSTVTIKRTVRNVGENPNAIYFVSVVSPNGVAVVVWPQVLVFSWFQEENSYYVTVRAEKKSRGRYDFGEIVWSDGLHFVRSPLVVCVNSSGNDPDGGFII